MSFESKIPEHLERLITKASKIRHEIWNMESDKYGGIENEMDKHCAECVCYEYARLEQELDKAQRDLEESEEYNAKFKELDDVQYEIANLTKYQKVVLK